MQIVDLLPMASTFTFLLMLAGLVVLVVLFARVDEARVVARAGSRLATRRTALWTAILVTVLGAGLSTWRILLADAESRRGPHTVEVRADLAWQNAGIVVRAGERVGISASGSWTNGRGAKEFGPEGSGGTDPASEVSSAPAGALVGQIGDWARFTVGRGTTMTAEKSGWLWLSMNDRLNGHDDNSGVVTVTVTVLDE